MASHFNDFSAYDVPPEYRPLGAWAYVGYSLLFSLPVVGLICLIVFSLSDSNLNRRNYARSYFIGLLIAVVLFAAFYFTGTLSVTMDAINAGEYPSYLSWLPWA